jgi:hypothetical protein
VRPDGGLGSVGYLELVQHAGHVVLDRLQGQAQRTIVLITAAGCVLALAKPDNHVGWIMVAAAMGLETWRGQV